MKSGRKTFTGWQTVFSFTARRHMSGKMYVALTLILSLVFFAIMAGIIIIPNLLYKPDSKLDETSLTRVILCDPLSLTRGTGWLEEEGDGGFFAGVGYLEADSLEDAISRADPHTLILAVGGEGAALSFSLISPDDSELNAAEVSAFVSYVNAAYRNHLIKSSGIDPALIAGIYSSVNINEPAAEPGEPDDPGPGYDPAGGFRTAAGMIFSYLVIFVMYMMIIFYGQGAAANVILEKSSKLMDLFLVSVKPAAMILGKVLATALAAFVQVISWGLGAFFGYAFGRFALGAFVASPSPAYLEIMSLLDALDGLFSPFGIITALLVMIAGFLLYCSIAAIGGAMASKPEDLSSTNLFFTLCIVASFLLSLYSGSSGGMVSSAKWLIYFPFTAILVTPGRALSGELTLLEGGISVALVALGAFLGIILAGKVYEMMSFYRGDPPKPAKILAILRDSVRSGRNKKEG